MKPVFDPGKVVAHTHRHKWWALVGCLGVLVVLYFSVSYERKIGASTLRDISWDFTISRNIDVVNWPANKIGSVYSISGRRYIKAKIDHNKTLFIDASTIIVDRSDQQIAKLEIQSIGMPASQCRVEAAALIDYLFKSDVEIYDRATNRLKSWPQNAKAGTIGWSPICSFGCSGQSPRICIDIIRDYVTSDSWRVRCVVRY